MAVRDPAIGLKRRGFGVSCALAVSSLLASVSSAKAPNPRYNLDPLPKTTFARRHSTLTHRLLDLESTTGAVRPEMYAWLDHMLDRAHAQIRVSPAELSTRDGALRILRAIDTLLTEENVVYPAWDFVGSVSEALTPVELDEDAVGRAKTVIENRNRTDHLNRRGKGTYYVADCDIISFFYISIADELNLPIVFVERPRVTDKIVGHNFVRWQLDGDYVDWDAMSGDFRAPADTEYVLNDDQMIGYAYALLGDLWQRSWNMNSALSAYSESLRRGYQSVAVLNGITWLRATASDPTLRDAAEAMTYAARLCNDETTDPSYLDTCAAAAARANQFQRATAWETKAVDHETGIASKARMQQRLAQYRLKHPYTQARRREETALGECDSAGDLLGKVPGASCPDPSTTHALSRSLAP